MLIYNQQSTVIENEADELIHEYANLVIISTTYPQVSVFPLKFGCAKISRLHVIHVHGFQG